jgi:hypothetical protein
MAIYLSRVTPVIGFTEFSEFSIIRPYILLRLDKIPKDVMNAGFFLFVFRPGSRYSPFRTAVGSLACCVACCGVRRQQRRGDGDNFQWKYHSGRSRGRDRE